MMLLEEQRMKNLLHELSTRIVHLEQYIEDVCHMLGRIEPTQGWAQHEINAYRERGHKELAPQGDTEKGGEFARPLSETSGRGGSPGATK